MTHASVVSQTSGMCLCALQPITRTMLKLKWGCHIQRKWRHVIRAMAGVKSCAHRAVVGDRNGCTSTTQTLKGMRQRMKDVLGVVALARGHVLLAQVGILALALGRLTIVWPIVGISGNLGFLGKFRGFFEIFKEFSLNLTGYSLI